MTDGLTCPTCLAWDLDAEELCDHRPRLCVPCCARGEHGWTPTNEWDAA